MTIAFLVTINSYEELSPLMALHKDMFVSQAHNLELLTSVNKH